jgi:hypothetical protein
LAKPISQILNQVVNNVSTARVSAPLFDLRHPAQCEQRRVARFLRRHACCKVLLGLLLEVVAKFIFEFLIHLFAAET